MEYLFAYGTLQDGAVQQSVFGRIIDGTPDELPDFRLSEVIIDRGKYFLAVPAAGQTISGTLLSVSESDLLSADRYETDAYRRVPAVLKSGKTAWVYVR